MKAKVELAQEHARDEGLDIGFVSMGFRPDVGGIETHTGELAREFIARGHRVHVLCLDGKSERAPYSIADSIDEGVRVRRVAYRYHDHGALADLGVRRAANDVVMAWLAEEPCDVVHVHHAGGFGAGILQAISDMGRPLCMTLHDYWMLCPRGQMFRSDGAVCEAVVDEACGACLRATWPHLMPSSGEGAANSDAKTARDRTQHALAMLALPAQLFAPSAASRDVFVRAGVAPEGIRVVENGVDGRDLAQRVELERRAAAGRDDFVRIGVLGSAQPSKGVLEFARAALSLDDAKLRVEVHGRLDDYHGDRSYVDALRKLAGRDVRLELCGEYAHADLARILARLDAVAVPSLWNETFGLSAREARCAGLFVFASDRGGLAALRDDPGVRLLASGDAQAWSAQVASFAREQRSRPNQRGFPAPANLRSVHQLALELEAHYVELVRKQQGREPVLAFEAGSDRPSSAGRAADRGTPANWWRRWLSK